MRRTVASLQRVARGAVADGYTGSVHRRLVIALVGFSLLSLIEAAEYGFWLHVNDKPISIGYVLLRNCPVWIAWALCVPAVTWWGDRFRLDWPLRAEVVMAHLAGIAVTTALFAAMRVLLEHSLGTAPPEDIWLHVRDSLVYSCPQSIITYSATVGLYYAASYAARSRQLLELQSELSKAQLNALRMQLNPHFFFNTLHTIGALVRDENRSGAVDMIERLGDVLRHVLRSDGDPEAPLRDEIAFLRKYLEIEHVRFGERLRVAWQIDPQAEDVPVPQLILQPLVENALRHGLSQRARPGSLTITADVVDDQLELVVTDDGVGLAADFEARAGHGVGLANVRARLQRMYGDAAQLSVTPGEQGGVIARVVLPVRADDEVEDD
jgi:hypothetical protein